MSKISRLVKRTSERGRGRLKRATIRPDHIHQCECRLCGSWIGSILTINTTHTTTSRRHYIATGTGLLSESTIHDKLTSAMSNLHERHNCKSQP